MKNDNPQEIKPVYIQEASYRTDDEISMTDLALILLRHKVYITTIFIAFLTTGLAFTLLTPKSYTYSTTIEIGSQVINGTIKPFESAHSLLAKIEHNYIPLVLSQHKQSFSDDDTKYEIKTSIPVGSNITLLEINGTEDISDTLIELLEKTSQKAIQNHSRIYQSIKSSLEVRLKQRAADLNFLNNSNNNETEVVSNRIHIEALSTQLANLNNTKQIQPPIRSLKPTSTSKALIVILFAFTGFFLGVIAAFMAEFFTRIKKKQNNVTN